MPPGAMTLPSQFAVQRRMSALDVPRTLIASTKELMWLDGVTKEQESARIAMKTLIALVRLSSVNYHLTAALSA